MNMRSTLPTDDHRRGKPDRPRNVQPRAESEENTATAGSHPHITWGTHFNTLDLPVWANIGIRSSDNAVAVRVDEIVNFPPALDYQNCKSSRVPCPSVESSAGNSNGR